MRDKIHMTELPCYPVGNEASVKGIHKIKKHFFDLSPLQTKELRKEMVAFIMSRGSRLSILTLDGERFLCNYICCFMAERHPKAKSFKGFSEEELVRQFKAWLLKNGYNIVGKHYMKNMGRSITKEAEAIKYLRKILFYFRPEDTRPEKEKDIWELDKLEYPVWQNPIAPIRTVKFNGIQQPFIRKEVKEACYIRFRYLSVGSVLGDIRAAKRLSEFLAKRYPKIQSCGEIERYIIGEYLIYIYTEVDNKEHFNTEISQLRSIIQEIGRIIEKPHLQELFLQGDRPKKPKIMFRYYSDETLKNLNAHIVNMDEQIARALIVHQMLGTRISDTLTLRTDCLYMDGEHHIVRIYQVKTDYFEKPVSEEVAALIEKSIEYTKSKYGDTEYVFVCDNDPTQPLQYSMLKNRVMSMIHEEDIRDENGKLLGFGSHLFRHCYGMKLTEMHLDDLTIARLLGHKNTRTVHHYRKMSGKALAKETRVVRDKMDEVLGVLIGRWDGYEKVFQDG